MKIRTETYTLPAYWACYLINGDASGLGDGEQAEIDSWCEAQLQLGSCINCDEAEFTHSGDDGNFGADRAKFTFYKLRKVDRTYTRPYVGMANGGWCREVFRSAATPTAEAFPKYAAVVGPFRTMAGARLCVNHPGHCTTVAGYERAARKLAETVRECARKAKEDAAARWPQTGTDPVTGERWRCGTAAPGTTLPASPGQHNGI